MNKKISIKKIAQLSGHQGGIFALAETDENHLFLSGAGDGWIVEWDLRNPKDGRLVAQAEDTQVSGRASVFALAKNNKLETQEELIIAGNMNGGLHWIFPNDTTLNKDILHHKKGVYDIQVVGDFLFTAGGKGLLTKWSIKNLRPLESIQLSEKSLRRMDFIFHNNTLAVGASDGNIYILDIENFSLEKTITNAHDNSVFTVQFSPDGKHLWSGGRDAHLKIWDIEKNYKLVNSVPAHLFTINAIVFSPDGKLVATGSRDKTIKIWDAENFQLLKVIDTVRDSGHINSVNVLLWSKYSDWLISGSDDRSVIVWSVSRAFPM